MGSAKSPVPNRDSGPETVKAPIEYFKFWNQTYKVRPRADRTNGRNETGWQKQRRRIRGNWLRDQTGESGETYEKELASAERMKRGYFNK